MADQQILSIDKRGAHSIDQYLEYKRIVRDDDGGKMFSDSEYENYKKTVVAKRMKNRLYVSWVNNETDMHCKQVGPESKCFCRHRFHQHKTDFDPDDITGSDSTIPSVEGATSSSISSSSTDDSSSFIVVKPSLADNKCSVKLKCEQLGCPCINYHYVSSFQVKCRCKHLMDNHHIKGRHSCAYPNCQCQGYRTTLTCSCGTSASKHSTIVQTQRQRLQNGLPIGRSTPYKAMGGLTGFSSLADGVQRLDPSGAGTPSSEFLSQPITSSDHPALKAFKQNESVYQRPGEDDMDYYERRYKERQKEEKMKARSIKK